MTYPKFHGLTLAANSVIENLHIERLSADPVPVNAGRIWFNSTEKKLKYSTLDGTGAVVVRAFSSAEDLQSDITSLTDDLAAEIARAGTAEAAIAADLASEIARATASETAKLAEAKTYTDTAVSNLVNGAPAVLDTLRELADALENNPDIVSVLRQEVIDGIAAAKEELKGTVTSAMDTLGELEVAVNNEIADRASAVAAETSARVSADNALDTRVTTVEGQVNGKIGDLTTLHTDAKSTMVAALNEVQDEITAEVAARTAAVASEATRATAAEATLTTDLAAEVTRAQAAEATLTTNLAAEVTRATAADAQTDAALAAEASARAAADTAEATARAEGDATLTADLAAEVTRATAAEGTLTADLATEAAARAAGETYVLNQLAAETTRATSAETTLATNLAAEVTRAQGEEAAINSLVTSTTNLLRADLNSEISRAQGAEATLAADLATEVAARTAADTAIRNDYTSHKYSTTSAAAALVHTITHSLNTDMFVMNVLTEGADGVYRNDVVPVEIIDANSIKIELSESRKVKVSIISMAAL